MVSLKVVCGHRIEVQDPIQEARFLRLVVGRRRRENEGVDSAMRGFVNVILMFVTQAQ